MPLEALVSSSASELAPHLVQRLVRAGAGAGKTTDLVRRVLDMERFFWQTQQRHCHLVVTTFTRKATQELRERLMAEALRRKEPSLIDFVQRPSQLHISTIHGVLSLYLTRFGSEMGLGPQFQILSARDLMKFNKRAFRQLIQKNPEVGSIAAEFLETLDLKSLLGALESYFSLWCQDQAHRVSQKDLEEVFAQQLKGTLKKVLRLISAIQGEDCPDKWTPYCERLKALAQSLQKSSVSESRRLVSDFVENVSVPSRSAKRPSEELGEFKKEVQDELKELAESRWSEESFALHEQQSEKFEILAKSFCDIVLQKKITSGSLSLADLELLAFRLAKAHPETARSFSDEWDYWMIDEYQDTSPLQVRLIELLMGEKKSFIVGDPQQSIYLFRGARSEVFAEKEQQVQGLPENHGETSELMTNYRSRPEVLKFFNSFFSDFQPMEVGYGKELPLVEDEAVQYLYCRDLDHEIGCALLRATELQKKGVPLEQICILSRSNEPLAKMARAASQMGLPVQVHSSSQFSQRREVQDAVALLKFLVNPYDNFNLLQLLRAPWLKVSDNLLQQIAGWGEEPYYLKALKLSGQSDGWSAITKLADYGKLSKTEGVTSVWLKALTELGILDLSARLDSSGRREANLWKLVSLVHHAEKLPGFSILQFIDQMTEVQVDSEGDSDATPVIEPRRVNLMTVHASKGLQFQYVILIGLGRKSPPPKSSFFIADTDSGKWTLSQQDPIERKWVSSCYGQKILQEKTEREELESDRVLYVALTRAILGVSLIWSEPAKKSWAQHIPQEIRVAAIEIGEEEKVFVQTGFSAKLRGGLSADQSSQKPISTETNSAVRAPWVSQSRKEGVETTSVTAILEDGKEAKAPKESFEKSSVASVKSLEKAIRGVEIHRMFEALKYQESFPTPEPAMQKAMNFVKTWQQGKILQWIRDGEVEWGFAVQHQGLLLQGQIDLWTKTDSEVLVIDYKTGSQIHKEKAFAQLEIYAWALQKMQKVPQDFPVKLVVIYPLDEAVFERGALLGDQIMRSRPNS
jgi:ATP-dependent helicase/nuclease subunit A